MKNKYAGKQQHVDVYREFNGKIWRSCAVIEGDDADENGIVSGDKIPFSTPVEVIMFKCDCEHTWGLTEEEIDNIDTDDITCPECGLVSSYTEVNNEKD